MGPVTPPSTARRALLTLVLWAGFWVLGLAVVAALAWVPIAESLYSGGLGWAGSSPPRARSPCCGRCGPAGPSRSTEDDAEYLTRGAVPRPCSR